MKKYNKEIRKKLKELATLVWKRELDQYVEELAKRFDEWREKKIDCFEINEYIHKFHDGPSRELWKKHNYFKADMIVAIGLESGILKNPGF
ncbi:MAG: hypothetical protein GXO98_08215 [Nitrospirae bacterium]|nr:hypothetical protein [Nitrospirota bacterium]